jgi:hypothetical protein
VNSFLIKLNKMKKYKHIKTGHIAIETHSGKNYKVFYPQSYTIPKWMIDESKEWIEFIERNFEVQTIKHKDSNYLLTRHGDNFFLPKMLLGTDEKTLISDGHIIHSVKRLSDGVVFTLGDTVKYNGISSSISEAFVIDNFFIRNDNRILLRKKNNTICEYIDMVDMIEKIEYLFITTDGVEIYKDDVYYTINYKNEIISLKGTNNRVNNLKTFSTNALAQTYRIFNSKNLSITDVQNVLGPNVKLNNLIKFVIKSFVNE